MADGPRGKERAPIAELLIYRYRHFTETYRERLKLGPDEIVARLWVCASPEAEAALAAKLRTKLEALKRLEASPAFSGPQLPISLGSIGELTLDELFTMDSILEIRRDAPKIVPLFSAPENGELMIRTISVDEQMVRGLGKMELYHSRYATILTLAPGKKLA